MRFEFLTTVKMVFWIMARVRGYQSPAVKYRLILRGRNDYISVPFAARDDPPCCRFSSAHQNLLLYTAT